MRRPAFEDDPTVELLTTLEIRITRKTKEVDGPRGWGEGAVEHMKVNRTRDGSRDLLLEIGGNTYRIDPKAIEAIHEYAASID